MKHRGCKKQRHDYEYKGGQAFTIYVNGNSPQYPEEEGMESIIHLSVCKSCSARLWTTGMHWEFSNDPWVWVDTETPNLSEERIKQLMFSDGIHFSAEENP